MPRGGSWPDSFFSVWTLYGFERAFFEPEDEVNLGKVAPARQKGKIIFGVPSGGNEMAEFA